MKTKIASRIIASIVMLMMSVVGLLSQEFGRTYVTLPLELSGKGRQTITQYLLNQVSSTYVRFYGESLVQDQGYYLDFDTLQSYGYKHQGSFTELSDAIKNVQFEGDIIELPDGTFDLRTTVSFFEIEGHVVLEGGSGAYVHYVKGGDLVVEDFSPFMMYPDLVTFESIGKKVSDARINTANGYVWVETIQSGSGTFINVPQEMIGRNVDLVMTSPEGKLSSVNLKDGSMKYGVDVIGHIFKLYSPDVLSIKNTSRLSHINEWSFYTNEGIVYGAFPLLDISTENDFTIDWFEVDVWGQRETIKPSTMFVKAVGSDSPEWKIPNGFSISLPKGRYQIRTEFERLKNPNEDPNPGKGVTENPTY